ncbi:MAG: hypothetical protein NTU66_04245 [Elusimicrobia bacterium]|nr:hypothetical protein [Elusimicrobiota bacterium]
MNTATIKKLAYLTVPLWEVPEDVQRFVAEKMSRADRKEFLFYLKQAWQRSQVYVRLAGPLDESVAHAIVGRYVGATIHYESTPELGGGLQIERDNTIIDISFRRMIETTFQRIKEN